MVREIFWPNSSRRRDGPGLPAEISNASSTTVSEYVPESGVLTGDVVDLDSAPGKLAPTVILSVVIKAGRISDPKERDRSRVELELIS